MNAKVRRDARIIALQVLYEVDTAHHLPGEVLPRQLAELPPDDERRGYAQHLVSGVVKQRDSLDAVLGECAPNYPVADIPAIDRNIVRIALLEIGSESVPVKVAINEAVEVAKQFGSDASPRFVNGVLAAAVKRPVAATTR